MAAVPHAAGPAAPGGCTGRRADSGSVLVLTLWLTAGLAAAALFFGHSVMLNYRRESNRLAALQAEHAAEGALQYVLQLLAETTPGDLPEPGAFTAEDIRIGGCRVWLLSRAVSTDASGPVFGLISENGRLNLNTATLETLQALEGMTADLAGAVIDWRDSDAELSDSGAESETYLGMDPPSTAKDAPFETVGELGRLNGADPVLLNGRDRNRNGWLEDWEEALAEEAGERFAVLPGRGFLDLFTVHSREPNTTAEGEPRVNLNGSRGDVRAALAEVLGGERADQVLQSADGGRGSFASVLEFCIRAGLEPAEAGKVLDRFTTVDGGSVPGRVNINTAPLPVLAALPGLDEDLAGQADAYRQTNSGSLENPLWLVDAVGEKAALAAAPHITVKSYQVTADIVAVAPGGRVFRRVCYIIDTASGSARIVARRDLTSLGWPLGADRRETLREEQQENLL